MMMTDKWWWRRENGDGGDNTDERAVVPIFGLFGTFSHAGNFLPPGMVVIITGEYW
jgi:hypothetical protein